MTDTRYARAGPTHVGYTVLEGDTELDRTIILAVGTNYPFEWMLQEPRIRRFIDGLAAFGRVVLFDRRGIGCSDAIEDWDSPLVEQWADDIAAVVEDAGLTGVTLFADLSGAAVVWASGRPPELERLILWNHLSRRRPSDTWGEEIIGMIDANFDGETDLGAFMSPDSFADPAFRTWSDRAGRAGASPSSARRMMTTQLGQGGAVDIDDRFRDVVVPTLVLVRCSEPMMELVPAEYWRRPLEFLPEAIFIDLSPGDSFPSSDVDPILAEISSFVTGEHRLPPPERVLAAVLFTDIVDSTAKAREVGDAVWKQMLDRHDAALGAAIGRYGGLVVKTTGDGVLATLPSATAAFRAARDLRAAMEEQGLRLRLGLHVGEIDRRGDDVSGLAVNVAARVMNAAAPGQLLASAMAMTATSGEEFGFTSVGTHPLKGIEGEWELFRVE